MSNILAEHAVDGGLSGNLTITRRQPFNPDVNPDLVFVESDLDLGSSLVLTVEQSQQLADVLGRVTA